MAGRVRRIEGHTRIELEHGWALAGLPPGKARTPAELASCTPDWITAERVGTVAAVLRGAGRFSLDGPVRRFDAEDFWYRCRLPPVALAPGETLQLCFDGLATVVEVFLDGASVLVSDDMFVAHAVDVSAGAEVERELLLRFTALDSVLRARKPRPRWRVPMIEQQQLRFIRTSLLGRTPGWSPPVAPVGPFRDVRLERRGGFDVERAEVRTAIENAQARIELQLQVRLLDAASLTAAELVLDGPGVQLALPARLEPCEPGCQRVALSAVVPGAQRWWPHTHGEQPLYGLALRVRIDGAPRTVDLGRVGFRSLALDTRDGLFRLSINDTAVFWRGACWTPLDVVSLGGSEQAYREALVQVRAAGMNMLRVVGSLSYEQSLFYDLCDELGIALWHDLMFSNMDYPHDDAFVQGVRREVGQVLGGFGGRPALALVCGDSEGEQQAAMWGAPRSSWQRPLFSQLLPELCDALLPGVPYWPSSSSGGAAYPHQPNAGPTSYYGVGAYLRPLEDARRSELRFASECLAFANVPEPPVLEALGGERTLHAHSPGWKQRSPRDLGAGWDFDDVRDHYLRELFGHDPLQLRYADHERYVALGRVVTGEVMSAAFAEWRRGRSTCGGALVWLLRDLWLGAGWGVIDAAGTPKAPYHYLRRALQPVGLAFSDEGLSGLYVHVFNEPATACELELRIQLFRHQEQAVGDVRVPLQLREREVKELAVGALLEGFVDLTRAFRFGPPTVDLVVGSLFDRVGRSRGEAFYFPLGLPRQQELDLGLRAVARPLGAGEYELTLETRRFAQSLALELGPYEADDAYFHLAPGARRTLRVRPRAQGVPTLHGSVLALNAHSAVLISVQHDAR